MVQAWYRVISILTGRRGEPEKIAYFDRGRWMQPEGKADRSVMVQRPASEPEYPVDRHEEITRANLFQTRSTRRIRCIRP